MAEEKTKCKSSYQEIKNTIKKSKLTNAKEKQSNQDNALNKTMAMTDEKNTTVNFLKMATSL